MSKPDLEPTPDADPARRRWWRRSPGMLALASLAALLVAMRTSTPRELKPRLVLLENFFADRVAFSPDGRVLAVRGPGIGERPPVIPNPETGLMAGRSTIDLRDAATGKPREDGSPTSLPFEPISSRAGVLPLAFSPDGTTLVAGNWSILPGVPHTPPLLRAWDVRSGAVKTTLLLPDKFGRSIAFADEGRTLLASLNFDADEERVLRWDTRDWRPLPDVVLAAPRSTATAFAPDGSAIAVAYSDRATITVYDLPSGRVRSTLTDPERAGTLRSFFEMRLSPDGRTLAVLCGDNAVQLWDIPTATLRSTLLGPGTYQPKMGFSPDGRTLAIGYAVSTRDDLIPRTLRRFAPLGPSPPPERSSGRLLLFDVASRRTRTFAGTETFLFQVSFAPDGRTLTTTGFDRAKSSPYPNDKMRVMFWDVPPAD